MAKAKRNEIYIRRTLTNSCMDRFGYYVFYNEKYKNPKKPEDWFNFYGILDLLMNTSEDFYKNGIKLKFEKNPVIKIPKKEKSTIEKLINRLEKDAKENRDLKYSLKIISELSNDKEHLSQYKK